MRYMLSMPYRLQPLIIRHGFRREPHQLFRRRLDRSWTSSPYLRVHTTNLRHFHTDSGEPWLLSAFLRHPEGFIAVTFYSFRGFVDLAK